MGSEPETRHLRGFGKVLMQWAIFGFHHGWWLTVVDQGSSGSGLFDRQNNGRITQRARERRAVRRNWVAEVRCAARIWRCSSLSLLGLPGIVGKRWRQIWNDQRALPLIFEFRDAWCARTKMKPGLIHRSKRNLRKTNLIKANLRS